MASKVLSDINMAEEQYHELESERKVMTYTLTVFDFDGSLGII